MIHFQALWKTKSFVKVCLKFKLPLWTKGLLIHLSPLWQLPLWHVPRWHNFPVYPSLFSFTCFSLFPISYCFPLSRTHLSPFQFFSSPFLSLSLPFPFFFPLSIHLSLFPFLSPLSFFPFPFLFSSLSPFLFFSLPFFSFSLSFPFFTPFLSLLSLPFKISFPRVGDSSTTSYATDPWKEETHTYPLVPNHRNRRLYSKNLGKGWLPVITPFRRRVTKNTFGGRELRVCCTFSPCNLMLLVLDRVYFHHRKIVVKITF